MSASVVVGPQARFSVGQPVRVRLADPPGHVRAPRYVRGHLGLVERICGAFPNPEERAYGRKGALIVLYRVRFDLASLWGTSGPVGDSVDVEIYENWLEPVDR